MNLKVCSIKCKIVLSTWLAAFIFTASLVAGNRPFPTTADTLSFLHITDMHLMFNLENYDRDIVYHREYTRNYKEGNSLFNQFMKTVPDQTGSDMIIATGDIIDFYDAKTKEVIAPTFRHDLFRLADLAEEVARFFGYDNIPTTLPSGEATTGKLPFKLRIEQVASDIAEFYGFSQGMSYSFESPKVFDKLLLPEDCRPVRYKPL